MSNPVNPDHYKGAKGFEAIDVMEAACSDKRSFMSHLQCTAMKYLYRLWRKDNPLQDAKKARWYLDRLIEELEAEQLASQADTPIAPIEDPILHILSKEEEDEGRARLASTDDRNDLVFVEGAFRKRDDMTELDALRLDFTRGKISRHFYEMERSRILGRVHQD